MSSDPKKPGFDAPPAGTPDVLQKDLSLDRRRRVSTFEELQATQPTDPMRPATPRPPSLAAPQDAPTQSTQKMQQVVPPGLQPRSPTLAATQPARVPPGAPPMQRPPAAATQPSRAPAPAAPPSPVEFAQARPTVMPQVTPSTPMKGAALAQGQQAVPSRASPAPLRPVPPRVQLDEPEPLTAPAAIAARAVLPLPPVARKPAQLPPEMLVTQPGLPGPFAHATAVPQNQAIPQRPPAMPELPRVSSGEQPSLAPKFNEPQFDEPLLAATNADTITAEPAAVWRRTGAWLTDLLFVSVTVLGFLTLAMTVIAPKHLTPAQQLVSVALPGLALAAILSFVYTTLFAFLWDGRTPGRRLMGIHLIDSTGHAPGAARALIRAMLSLVSFGLFLSGFWLALFDRHGQTLHDKLTRTFVVKLQDA